MKYVLVFTKGVGPLLRLASDFLARAALPSNNRRANTPALKRGPLLGADRRPLGNCPRRQPDSCESAFLSIYPLRTSTPPVVGSLAGFGNAIRPCDRGRRSVWSDLRFGQLPGRRRSGRNSAGRLS